MPVCNQRSGSDGFVWIVHVTVAVADVCVDAHAAACYTDAAAGATCCVNVIPRLLVTDFTKGHSGRQRIAAVAVIKAFPLPRSKAGARNFMMVRVVTAA